MVTYEFTNPETGDKEFTASQGDWRLRLEAGYQYSSKPISLGKTTKQPVNKTPVAALSPCAARKMMLANAAVAKKTSMNVRIQPYAGMAFIPNPQTALSNSFQSNQTVYQYNAGNWTSAITTGVNLAFAKGSTTKFVIGLQYLVGLGNMKDETLTTPLDNKQLSTKLSSHASAWNVTVGMPLSFSKPKPAVVKSTVEAPAKVEEQKPVPAVAPAATPVKKTCGYYKHRCGW